MRCMLLSLFKSCYTAYRIGMNDRD
eukprot:COSAG02_NODE_35602_length_466_cov_0.702997_1_plen_24_part_10